MAHQQVNAPLRSIGEGRDNAQQVHINIWTSQEEDKKGYQGFSTARGDEIIFHSFSYEE